MYINSLGLVINRRFYSENDKLVTIYTREVGKINAVATGARKINAKLSAATEPLSESEFAFFSSQSNRLKIVGGKLITSFPELRNNFMRYTTACKVTEVINLLIFGNLKNENKYNLIRKTLELIQTSIHPERIYLAFLLRFLNLCGYGIELNRCIKCSSQDDIPFKFSLTHKGVLCNSCAGTDSILQKIDTKTLTFFRNLSTLSGNDIDKMDIPGNIEKFIKQQCELYLLEYTQRPLKTEKIIKEMGLSKS